MYYKTGSWPTNPYYSKKTFMGQVEKRPWKNVTIILGKRLTVVVPNTRSLHTMLAIRRNKVVVFLFFVIHTCDIVLTPSFVFFLRIFYYKQLSRLNNLPKLWLYVERSRSVLLLKSTSACCKISTSSLFVYFYCRSLTHGLGWVGLYVYSLGGKIALNARLST